MTEVHGSDPTPSNPSVLQDGTKPKRPTTVFEAFANTARALRQSSIERIRVVGLSKGCHRTLPAGQPQKFPAKGLSSPTISEASEVQYDEDGIRIVTERGFMQEFVFQSRPCIILDAIEDWPAMQRWKDDRYLFDLDHHLPSESEPEDDDDDDDDDDTTDNGSKAPVQGVDNKTGGGPINGEEVHPNGKSNVEHLAQESSPEHGEAQKSYAHGPKKVTVALTPNGRADAVTYVLYDKRDVPEALRGSICDTSSTKQMVRLTKHPLLTTPEQTTAEDDNIVAEKVFMYAAEVKVTLPELYELLSRSLTAALSDTPMYIDMRTFKAVPDVALSMTPVIAYAQLQNNCLNREYAHLRADVQPNVVEFGCRAFGVPPEAANVWFGIPASVSSLHQDWVENLYAVVRGVKEFVLIPPWEGIFVPKPDLPSAPFELDPSCTDRAQLKFGFTPYPRKDGSLVPWFDFDITSTALELGGEGAAAAALREAINENDSLKKRIDPQLLTSEAAKSASLRSSDAAEGVLHPLVAHVHAGETLYLPALWLHRVAQRADERDVRARARHLVQMKKNAEAQPALGEHSNAPLPPNHVDKGKEEDRNPEVAPPLPLIAAVNYWYDISYTNPAVVMLQEFGLLL